MSTSQGKVAVFCSREGNRVTLVMRQTGVIIYHELNGNEHPAYTPQKSLTLYLVAFCCKHTKTGNWDEEEHFNFF